VGGRAGRRFPSSHLCGKPRQILGVEITNPYPKPTNFTWTVASSAEETHQPWIELPTILDFGTRPPASHYGLGFDVWNRGAATLLIDDMEFWFGEGFFELGWGSSEIEPGKLGAFDLSFDPYFDYALGGEYEAEIRVYCNAPNTPPDGYRQISVRAIIDPPI
jgi:hypothetical protein